MTHEIGPFTMASYVAICRAGTEVVRIESDGGVVVRGERVAVDPEMLAAMHARVRVAQYFPPSGPLAGDRFILWQAGRELVRFEKERDFVRGEPADHMAVYRALREWLELSPNLAEERGMKG